VSPELLKYPPENPGVVGVVGVGIHTIEHKKHRYPTTGDWLYDPSWGYVEVRTSRTADWRESMCVAVHELIEALLCVQHGVDPKAVDEFDIAYEARRAQGLEDEESEPGDDVTAPYYHQHQVAMVVERLLANELGLHWPTYNTNLGKLNEPLLYETSGTAEQVGKGFAPVGVENQ
jgi:hypothetical protein